MWDFLSFQETNHHLYLVMEVSIWCNVFVVFISLLVENSSKTLIGLFVVCLHLRFDSWPVAMSVWGSSTEINFQYETLLHYPISGLNDSNYEQHCFCDEIMFVA